MATTSEHERAQPHWRRVALAFIAGASAPVLLVAAPLAAVFGRQPDVAAVVALTALAFGIVLAFVPALVFGAPIYLLLRWRGMAITAWGATLAGAGVASVNAVLLEAWGWASAQNPLDAWDHVATAAMAAPLGAGCSGAC